MVKNNLHYPATYIHEINGKKYKLEGILTNINESTCTMKFQNRTVSKIPVNEIYLNENFIDDIKAAGKKVWGVITDVVKTVKGFILPVDEDGNELLQFVNTPVNVAGMTLPDSVRFAPSEVTKEAVLANGGKVRNNYNIDTVFAESEQRESEEGNLFWKRVMKEYIKEENESLSFTDTYKLVTEKYYHDTITGKKNLNEALIPSLHNIVKDAYGKEIGTKELIGRVKSYLLRYLDNEHAATKPILIWGAPGIGKTTILKQAAKLVQPEGYSLDIVTMACAALKYDDFTLPDTTKNLLGQKYAIEAPKTWLPVYSIDGLSDKQIKMTDDFYNASAYKIFNNAYLDIEEDIENEDTEEILDKILRRKRQNNEKIYNGGILFFDEYGRLRPEVGDIMMNLMGDRRFGGMILASKWITIGASNRLQDDLKPETDAAFRKQWGAAKLDRFQMYTYVPTKAEWIEWAREVNENGEQNIDELLVAFIEQAPEGVWYATLGNGAVPMKDKNIMNAISNGDYSTVGDFLEDYDENEEAIKMRSWTGRTWDEKINRPIKEELKTVLFRHYPGLYDSIFTSQERTKQLTLNQSVKYNVKNIDMDKLNDALLQVSDNDWFEWVNDKYQKIPGGEILAKRDRLQFVMQWIGKIVIPEALGGDDILPVTEWNKYNRISTIFDATQLRSIWEKGELTGAALKKDDNLYFDTTGGYTTGTKKSKWKDSARDIEEVISIILKSYPGNLEEDLQKDYKNLVKAENEEATIDDIKKYLQEYAIILINGETHEEIKDNYMINDNVSDEDAFAMAKLLNNSKVARLFANAINYIAKISYQVHMDGTVKRAVDELAMKLKAIYANDAKLTEYFSNHPDILSPCISIAQNELSRDLPSMDEASMDED